MAYTTIDDSSLYFHTQLYTGTGSNQDIVNDAHSGDFKPDLLWVKNRGNGGYDPLCFDSTRGLNKILHLGSQYDLTTEELGGTGGVQTFNANGYRGGSSTNFYQTTWVNSLDQTYVGWQWKVNGGTTTTLSNTGPDSVVQLNTTAGLNILTYTGNGSNSNIKHGMGAVPDMIIVKRRTNAAAGWAVWHKDLATPASNFLQLTETAAEASGVWDGVHPTDEKFFISGNSSFVNKDNSSTYVAYVFKGIPGYSRFGKYLGTGNGNGPVVYLGFKPAFIVIKRIDSTSAWTVYDNKRGVINGNPYELFLNSREAEYQGVSYFNIDILSNGFKIRLTDASINASGGSYVYMAFAENPFVTSDDVGSIPTTAV